VLSVAYGLLVIEGVLGIGRLLGWQDSLVPSPALRMMIAISFAAFVWRMIWRFHFTAREHGLAEGALAVPRIFVANIIAILAGRRALAAYFRTLMGAAPAWEKTRHSQHPATAFAVPTVAP
jgi:adsorption protein B